MSYDVGSTASMRRSGNIRTVTPEDEQKAMRAICGARACRDAKEAKHILQVLGLIEAPEPVRKPPESKATHKFYGNQYV